jgi:hypothetical protein
MLEAVTVLLANIDCITIETQTARYNNNNNNNIYLLQMGFHPVCVGGNAHAQSSLRNMMAQSVMLPAGMREMTSSNLYRDADYCD